MAVGSSSNEEGRCTDAMHNAIPTGTHDQPDHADPTEVPSHRRRTFLRHCSTLGNVSLLSLALLHSSTSKSHAAATTDAVVLLKGTVTLPPGITLPPTTTDPPSTAALYITARPNTPDNVPRAILDGSRGKPPPVLTARLTDCYSFPIEFALTAEDLTAEGRGVVGEGSGGYWWGGEDLVVSARWDTDGVAATRDPSDLVGRGVALSSKEGGGVVVPLQGRGFTGKLVTGKGKR